MIYIILIIILVNILGKKYEITTTTKLDLSNNNLINTLW